MRRIALVALLVALGSVVAQFHVAMQTYVPVIRVASPDGMTYTALFDARTEWRACADANRRFLVPLKVGCAQCAVVFARCERWLDGLQRAPGLWFSAPGLRIAIAGPDRAASSSCAEMAADFFRRGVRTASCTSARQAAKDL